MELFNHLDTGFGRHGFGHHGWEWFGFVPLILWAVLIGVAIWAILRFTSHRGPAVTAGPTVPPVRPDNALEEVRLRYARGEMSREEFVQRAADLGGTPPEHPDPSRSDAG
jgi:putative membrane protein